LIDVSTTRLLDHLKWRFFQQKVENYVMSKCTTSFGPIRRLNLVSVVGYMHMQSLMSFAFSHLSKHQTLIQAFCRYVNLQCGVMCFSIRRAGVWATTGAVYGHNEAKYRRVRGTAGAGVRVEGRHQRPAVNPDHRS